MPSSTLRVDLGQHPRLGVPLVAAHPGPEHPVRRQLRAADLGEVGGEHGAPACRRTAAARRRGSCRCRRPTSIGSRSAAVWPTSNQVRRDVRTWKPQPLAAGDDGERRRAGRCGAPCCLYCSNTDGVEAAAPLVEGVEALAEADDVLVGVETRGRSAPARGPSAVTSHSTDSGMSRSTSPSTASSPPSDVQTPGQRPRTSRSYRRRRRSATRSGSGRLVRCGRQHGSPDRQPADVGAGAAGRGEVTVGVGWPSGTGRRGRRAPSVDPSRRRAPARPSTRGDADGSASTRSSQRLAGDRVHRVALVGVDAVRVAAAERAVGDGRDVSHRAA